nr:MAG TPA: hypothetical protein [Bacteriophage sp.]
MGADTMQNEFSRGLFCSPLFLCHNSELVCAMVARICRYCCILLRRGIHTIAGERVDP